MRKLEMIVSTVVILNNNVTLEIWQEELNKLVRKYGKEALIKSGPWGSEYTISYKRLETDEELKKRIRNHKSSKKSAQTRKEKKIKKDLDTLKRLQKIYPGFMS